MLKYLKRVDVQQFITEHLIYWVGILLMFLYLPEGSPVVSVFLVIVWMSASEKLAKWIFSKLKPKK